MSNIKVNQIEYHRNGSVNQGFFALSFRFTEDNRQFSAIATVFKADEHVAILTLDEHGKPELSRGWRGDMFESELREAVALYEENGYSWVQEPAKETPKVGYYAYHDDEADLIVKALDKASANRKALALEIELSDVETEVFDTEEEAQYYLDTFKLQKELEDVQDRLNRGHRMPTDDFTRLQQRRDDLAYELQGR